jgi:acyl carrier protein
LIADVQAKTARALGISPSAEIDRRQPLSEMGLDSLMAVELRNALGAVLSLSLPATLLFDYPSIEKVTDYLCTKIPCLQSTEDAARATAGASDVAIGTTLDAIERLSDGEIDQLFGERMEKQTRE